MLKNFDISHLIFIILVVFLGITCYKLYSAIEKLEYIKQDEINLLDEKLRRNESIIDSLENDISLRESIIDSLSFSHREVIIEKKIIIDEVKALPLTEAVEFLGKNLKMYEELDKANSMSNTSFIF